MLCSTAKGPDIGPELAFWPIAQADAVTVGIPIAFAAGMLSFLSPCVLPHTQL